MRPILSGEIDDQHGGVAGEADVREDMDHGCRGKGDVTCGCLDERFVETMKQMRRIFVGTGGS